MRSDLCYDAIVIGSGPSGSSAAYHLRRLGAERVLVLERLSDAQFARYHRICGEAVSARSLKRAGITVDEVVCSVHTLTISFSPESSVSIPVEGVIIDRPSLVRRLVSESGAELVRCTVVSVSFDGSLYNVDANGESYRTPILIGADGAHSIVRRCIFGTAPEEMLPIENCLVPGDSDGTLRFAVGGSYGGTYSWRFPSADGMVSVGSVRGWERPYDAAVSGARHIPIGKVPSVTDGHGCYLVGDSAGLANPLCFGGIGAAMISGRKAAEAAMRGMPGSYERFISRDRMFDGRFMDVHRQFAEWTDEEIADAMSPFRKGYSVGKGIVAMIRRPGYARIYFGCWLGFGIGWRI